jgi:putative transposase
MGIRKINFAIGEFYHIYNRGNSKQKIFKDEEDYLRFITLLFTCNSVNNFNLFAVSRSKESAYLFERGEQIVSIGAYVLMRNHFHILIKEKKEGGISKFMQKLSTAYVMYYNKKYNRNGGLFEGKFKSRCLNTDRYLKYIFSYIHLNIIKLIQKDWKERGIKNKSQALGYLNNYQYSSYLDYIGVSRVQNKILNKNDFPRYFGSINDFKEEIFEWLNYEE